MIHTIQDRLGEIDWSALQPGDEVRLPWRPAPYAERVVFSARGTAAARIKLVGVPGPNGEKPVISGIDATTDPQFAVSYPPLEANGLFTLWRTAGQAADFKPGFLTVQGIRFTGASKDRPGNSFTNAAGQSTPWADHASGIYGVGFDSLWVEDCEIDDNGNGILVTANDRNTDVRILRNYFHGNGGVNSSQCHATYVEADGEQYIGNRYGRHRPGSGGGQLKSRGRVEIVTLNRFEGGARQVDLGTAESSSGWMRDLPGYLRTPVRHNVFELLAGDGIQIMFVEGRTNTENTEQQVVDFEHNTVVVRRSFAEGSGACIIAHCWEGYNPPATLNAAHNLFYSSRQPDQGPYANGVQWWYAGNRTICTAPNVLPAWAAAAYRADIGSELIGDELNIKLGGNEVMPDPGFVDLAGGDYALLPTSPYIGFGADMSSVPDPGPDPDPDPDPTPDPDPPPAPVWTDVAKYQLRVGGSVLAEIVKQELR